MSDSDDPSDGEELATVIPLRGAESSSGTQDPIVGPTGAAPETGQLVAVPRLARHEVVLDDDHRVGVAVCGQGVPVVLVHGFTAEGILYAQTLSRLVRMGFKVIAVDVAGHGGTQGLPTGGEKLESYTRLLARVLDELGVRRALFAGHSMGGRLVTQLVASQPDRAIGVVLIDAVVGDCWDRLIRISRFAPPVLLGVAAALAVDTLSTLPWLQNPRQAVKLGRLVGGTLVTIHGGTHSWVLKDPETLPAVIAELLDGPLARVRAAVLGAAGLAPDATPEQMELAFLGPHALVRRLTPSPELRTGGQQHRRARYRWTVDSPAEEQPA